MVGSERFYWYWGGIDLDSLSVLSAFYGVAVAVAAMTLAMSPGAGWRRAILGGAVFALIVEGIITPVMYEDGPLPVLFLMFVGWHGVVAFAGLVYFVRRCALDGQTVRLAIASTITGAAWGLWALASAVTDRETAEEIARENGGSTEILDPTAFGVYAVLTTVALVVAHVAADRLWPKPGWAPSRFGLWVTAIAVLFCGATLVMPVVPWAPLKLGLIAWVLWRLLRRTAEPAGRSTVIDELAGRARLCSLVGLFPLPAAAVAVYASLWPLRSGGGFSVVFWSMIAAQVAAGVVALALAARRPSTAAESDGHDHVSDAAPTHSL